MHYEYAKENEYENENENKKENKKENDNENKLNDDWIHEFENNDKLYQHFYKDDLLYTKVHYVYINKNNNIEKIKDDTFYMSKPNYISREEIIGLIKRNSFDNNIRFSILSILKYNINLDAEDVKIFLNKKYLNTFLTPIRNIDAITFDKTIHMFQDLNDLFLIFYEHSNDKKEIKNVTKRVYINLNTKKKTYRK